MNSCKSNRHYFLCWGQNQGGRQWKSWIFNCRNKEDMAWSSFWWLGRQHTLWGLVVCWFHKWEAYLWLCFACWPFLAVLFQVFWQECLLEMLESVWVPFPTTWFAWALSGGILAVLSPLLDPSKTCPVPICMPLCLSQFHGVGCGDFEAVFSHVHFSGLNPTWFATHFQVCLPVLKVSQCIPYASQQCSILRMWYPVSLWWSFLGLGCGIQSACFVSLSSRSLNAFHKLPISVLHWGCGIQSACGGLSLVWEYVSRSCLSRRLLLKISW